jgi:hypothetical protein
MIRILTHNRTVKKQQRVEEKGKEKAEKMACSMQKKENERRCQSGIKAKKAKKSK